MKPVKLHACGPEEEQRVLRERMIQKRSKMTIILDILPVKIHVSTAIAAENKASA